MMTALDAIIHQPARLRIMAALTALEQGDQVEFTYLRDVLDLTDGNIGAHLRKLEDAGYVKMAKTFVARKPRTFIRATKQGRAAFVAHVAALEAILHALPADDSEGA